MKTQTRIIIGSIILVSVIGIFLTAIVPLKEAFVESDKITKSASPNTFKVVNVNTATVQELDKLPNIGMTKAKAIVDYREKFGPFQELKDLLNVPGIGQSTLDKISSIVTGFSSSTSKNDVKSGKIKINEATAKEIENLPSIGPIKAREIVDYRETHGPFHTPSDLMKVNGIGPKTVDKIKDLIEF